ncbi:MAG: UDP-N-acetylmuramoyl-L-alanyl-D-glutamate--2,6-diaminopimelate ligase [Methylococcales bacterium]|nr:UDP-N-acetylmuramoyl-L-alanyl-D-glutamate--2,6-diaminopimelate ligase [Methylococcales bacterium]
MVTLSTLMTDWLTAPDLPVGDLHSDSRQIQPGDVFIALPGAARHGLDFAEQAVAHGASAVLYQPDAHRPAPHLPIPALAWPELARQLPSLAARRYGDALKGMNIWGITGTNGKTSCSQFLAQVWPQAGVIGTLGWGRLDALVDTGHTTPDILTVYRSLACMRAAEVEQVAMEVSSHALAQQRVAGISFQGAVFTNLSRDHLDYHGNMDAYLAAKLKLFEQTTRYAVIHLDHDYAEPVLAALPRHLQMIGVSRRTPQQSGMPIVYAETLTASASGTLAEVHWQGQKKPLSSTLIGDFMLDNVLAVLAALLAQGQSLESACQACAQLTAVPGRMQHLGGDDLPDVLIDYAHTPDALSKALTALRPLTRGRLWLVFGCGGDRDRGKRALMGEVASTFADSIILTDDNPRNEAPASIVADIMRGCRQPVTVIHAREQAIGQALREAQAGDVVLIAGKGHEAYQHYQGVKRPFRDHDIAQQCLTELATCDCA